MYPNPNPVAPHPALPVPALVDSQKQSADAIESVKLAGKRHSAAVRAAIAAEAADDGWAPDNLVQEILNAGGALDRALFNAIKCGYGVDTLAAISEVHPLYIDMLRDTLDEL